MTVIALLRREGLMAPPVTTGKQGGFTPRLQALGVSAAALLRRRSAHIRSATYMPLVRHLEQSSLSPANIAISLNSCGYTTTGGLIWNAAKIRLLIARENRAIALGL